MTMDDTDKLNRAYLDLGTESMDTAVRAQLEADILQCEVRTVIREHRKAETSADVTRRIANAYIKDMRAATRVAAAARECSEAADAEARITASEAADAQEVATSMLKVDAEAAISMQNDADEALAGAQAAEAEAVEARKSALASQVHVESFKVDVDGATAVYEAERVKVRAAKLVVAEKEKAAGEAQQTADELMRAARGCGTDVE